VLGFTSLDYATVDRRWSVGGIRSAPDQAPVATAPIVTNRTSRIRLGIDDLEDAVELVLTGYIAWHGWSSSTTAA